MLTFKCGANLDQVCVVVCHKVAAFSKVKEVIMLSKYIT